jgi:hypothetical protein
LVNTVLVLLSLGATEDAMVIVWPIGGSSAVGSAVVGQPRN